MQPAPSRRGRSPTNNMPIAEGEKQAVSIDAKHDAKHIGSYSIPLILKNILVQMECKSDLRFKRKCDLELGTCFAFQHIPPLIPRHLAASPLHFRPLRAHCSPLLCIVCNSVFCTDLKYWKMVNKKSSKRYIRSTPCRASR